MKNFTVSYWIEEGRHFEIYAEDAKDAMEIFLCSRAIGDFSKRMEVLLDGRWYEVVRTCEGKLRVLEFDKKFSRPFSKGGEE